MKMSEVIKQIQELRWNLNKYGEIRMEDRKQAVDALWAASRVLIAVEKAGFTDCSSDPE